MSARMHANPPQHPPVWAAYRNIDRTDVSVALLGVSTTEMVLEGLVDQTRSNQQLSVRMTVGCTWLH